MGSPRARYGLTRLSEKRGASVRPVLLRIPGGSKLRRGSLRGFSAQTGFAARYSFRLEIRLKNEACTRADTPIVSAAQI